MIDIKSILDELGIDYKESGKNVAANDVNIDCPFCNAEKHLGVSLRTGQVNCWVCTFEDLERRPTLMKVLTESTGLYWKEVQNAMLEHGWEPYGYESDKTGSSLATKCWLPKEARPLVLGSKRHNEALEYLSNRGFGERTIDKYNLGCALSGSYRNRIIIPITFNGKLVAFTGRRFAGSSENRYKNSPMFMSSVRIRNLLYNYDSAKNYKHAYLLEGPPDIWQMGDDSMGVFRSALSPYQRRLILGLHLESITIIFDPFATNRAYAAAVDLSPFIRKIKVVRLDGGKDVADRTRNEILEIEEETQLYRG